MFENNGYWAISNQAPNRRRLIDYRNHIEIWKRVEQGIRPKCEGFKLKNFGQKVKNYFL